MKTFTVTTTDKRIVDIVVDKISAVVSNEDFGGVEIVVAGMPVIPVPNLTREQFWEEVSNG